MFALKASVSQNNGILYRDPHTTPAHHTVNTTTPIKKNSVGTMRLRGSHFTIENSASAAPTIVIGITMLNPVSSAMNPPSIVMKRQPIAIIGSDVHTDCEPRFSKYLVTQCGVVT